MHLFTGPLFKVVSEGATLGVINGKYRVNFDTATGYILNAFSEGKPLALGGGPVLAGAKQSLHKFSHYTTANNDIVVEAEYTGDASLQVKWTFTRFMPAKLEYTYTQTAPANFYGITFQLSDTSVRSVRWLGDGPYRVWRNRRQGVGLDVWEKKYNNAITGETFEYPEFKGYHANLYWATILGKGASFTVYAATEGLFLQLLQPATQHTKPISHVNPPFPTGGLGFLHAIAPIGTKFHAANVTGPNGQLNNPLNGTVSGTLWFDL
jgi:hypothetical protein